MNVPFARTIAVTLMLAMLPALCIAAQSDQASSVETTAEPASPSGNADSSKPTPHRWWDRNGLASLEISPEQKSSLEQLHARAREQNRARFRQQKALRSAFDEALDVGDVALAREKAAELSRWHAEDLENQVGVFEQLQSIFTPEQWTRLNSDFPRLLRQPPFRSRDATRGAAKNSRADKDGAVRQPRRRGKDAEDGQEPNSEQDLKDGQPSADEGKSGDNR